ncbi:peregrin-like isoform X2 [Teleopsis dalmanni]|uniref:peregrin-like isoform X2 n=1 Tax=Teleopsis dalmanni TaxID=139649 RepID=UPI0018CE7FBA|nr:peregrin-like isoform X2 [Teleopsis dalmanni]XP_037948137.1 peregrin-like isoform X2 [Teleopsis dalmanni]
MGLDFDAVEYCKKVKYQQPPYACPVSKCDRSYKTIVGLQYHLLNYDHDNPTPITPILTPHRKRARTRGTKHTTPKASKNNTEENSSSASSAHHVSNPESLVTYNEDEQCVTFNIHGKSVRLGINTALPFIDAEEYKDLVERGCVLNADAPPLEENAPWAQVKVPEAVYREIANYNVPDAPPRPLAYYRFIEKSAEELDGEIEYDVDEEDTAWLDWMNGEREKGGLNTVSVDTMELLMDRLEKESYFQAAANGTATGAEVDDDAVCCICMDGECQNTNVILFCDMCNLAVHQDCYGVPYIPEGQWLCRRCLQSPSTPVHCVLCPNTGGAFKQTDQGQWAHVVCALWIPEVRFANTVFLEPIDSIETIPGARWRLTCYVCKEKGMGACIQCQRNSCYAAFHVTCAQQAGLYMTMDFKDGHNDSTHLQKSAYCHAHTPPDAKLKTNQKDFEDTRQKMKEARKTLAKKRSTAPVVLLPTIPPERVHEISSMVHMQKKSQFIERLIAYWTLKRKYRNGVPLLRRLQSQGNHHCVIQRNGIEGSPDTDELYRQLKYWQCLRQDLERARLLCELVRKREKVKAVLVKICEQVVMLQINPLESSLTKLLDALEAKDTSEIFKEPVDTKEVPDYLDIVKYPMDLGTMREKLKNSQYSSFEQLESDFDLMIQNCLAYNNKDTVFYRAGIRMRDQAAPLFVQIRKDLEREGLVENQREQRDHVEMEVEDELKQLLASKPCEEIIQKLLILADKSQVLKNPVYRTKKIKQIRVEITRMRKAIQKAKTAARFSNSSMHSQTEEEDEEMDTDVKINDKYKSHSTNSKRSRKTPANSMILDEDETMGDESKETLQTTQTPPCSPIKSLNNSASPVGVNRRTAVLFTRKAQAAKKRPSETTTPVKEETISSLSATLSNNNNANATNSGAAMAASLATTALMLNNKLGVGHISSLSASLGLSSSVLTGVKSPKRNSRHKRLSDVRNSASMSPKKSPNLLPPAAISTPTASALTSTHNDLGYNRIPDSFRVYRANTERDVSESDDDDVSDISGSPCSSCSGISMSGSGSEYDSSDDDDDDDDEEDEEDEEEDDEDEADGEEQCDDEINENNTDRNKDVIAPETSKDNGEAMSCSADSASDEETVINTGYKKTNIKTRTSTPTGRRSRAASRLKQKNGTIAEVAPAEPIQNNIGVVTNAKTRAAIKQAASRAATPTVANIVNNSRNIRCFLKNLVK